VNATEAANRLVTWSAVDPNAGLAEITGTTITANAPVTAATNLTIKATSTVAATVSATRTITVNPHSFKISFNGNGNTDGSMTQQNVTYGSTTATFTKNTFTRTNYEFEGWTTASNGTGTVFADEAAVSASLNGNNDTKTPNGTVTLYAKWSDLGVIAAGQADNPNLMVKFGIKPAGYSSASAEDVTKTFLSVQAYINKAAVTASNVDNASAKLGVIALGNYVDLPALSVTAYNGQGAFSANNARVEVVGVSSYIDKNGNGSGKHLVFQFKDVMVNRRMNATATNAGGYAASEMRKYLTTVSEDANSGKFLAGLLAAGVPQTALWAPSRVIGGNSSNKSTVTDSVYLPTVWEVAETNNSTQSGSTSDAMTANEGTENQGRLTIYGAGEGGNNGRVKSGATWYWLASTSTYYLSPGYSFCLVYYLGFIDGANASFEGGVAPVFCVK
jgi:uncharacterized repeat protein (TIGR02543 family)